MRNRLCFDPRLMADPSPRPSILVDGVDPSPPIPESSDLDWVDVRMIVLTGNRRSGRDRVNMEKNVIGQGALTNPAVANLDC